MRVQTRSFAVVVLIAVASSMAILLAWRGFARARWQRHAERQHLAWHSAEDRSAQPARPNGARTPTLRAVLWAWESPQDLRLLDPAKANVAFLAGEVFLQPGGADLKNAVVLRRRRQTLLLPPGLHPQAVVRVIALPGFRPDQQTAVEAARAVAWAASEPNVSGVQVDFDATASQRDFYRDLLQHLRSALPPRSTLTITALVNWCGPHSWLQGLPVDAAVPMFFRMGGPASSRALAARDAGGIVQPLCRSAAGVSTDERWPAFDFITPRPAAIYIFHPGPWSSDALRRLNTQGFAALSEVH